MNQCPDCESPLPQTATACRCGWTLQRVSTEIGGCEFEIGCSGRPMTKIQTEAGWKLCCERHYLEYHRPTTEVPEDLRRRPNEPFEVWRKRQMTWLVQQTTKKGRAA